MINIELEISRSSFYLRAGQRYVWWCKEDGLFFDRERESVRDSAEELLPDGD